MTIDLTHSESSRLAAGLPLAIVRLVKPQPKWPVPFAVTYRPPRPGDVVACREPVDAICAELLKPQKVYFWGNWTTFTPTLLRQTWGDGQQLLQLFPLNERPRYWVVRVDSTCSEKALWDIIDDIYEAIDEQFGPIPEHDAGIGNERPYFPSYDEQGASWHFVSPIRFRLPLVSVRVCRVRDVTEQEAEWAGYVGDLDRDGLTPWGMLLDEIGRLDQWVSVMTFNKGE